VFILFLCWNWYEDLILNPTPKTFKKDKIVGIIKKSIEYEGDEISVRDWNVKRMLFKLYKNNSFYNWPKYDYKYDETAIQKDKVFSLNYVNEHSHNLDQTLRLYLNYVNEHSYINFILMLNGQMMM
jgi:hypothetical protein